MSQSLGSLYVELKANAQDFVDGMSKAAYIAKQSGRDIQDAFSKIGELAGTALAPLGEIGEVVERALGSAGQAAGALAKDLGGLGGAIGAIGAVAGAAVGTLAAIEAASVGLAVHTAEGAANLLHLSQSTGVAVETLSAYSFAAKQTGVSQDSLVGGLERLSKSIAKAAAEPATAVTVFSRLGVELKNAGGSVRDTSDIMGDLAEAFSRLKPGAETTAAAIEIFGRGGAALAPLLREGRDGIEELLDKAQSLGVVLNTQTAEASEKFVRNLDTIKAAGEGVALSLTTTLLPQLQAVSDTLVEALKDPTSQTRGLIDAISTVSRYFLEFGGLVALIFKQAGTEVKDFGAEVILNIRQAYDTAAAFVKGGFDAAKVAAASGQAELLAQNQAYIAETEKNWNDYKEFLIRVNKDTADSTVTKSEPTKVLKPAPAPPDAALGSIQKQIDAIHRQSIEALALANATNLSTAEQRAATIAAQADADVSKLLSEAQTKEGAERQKLVAYIRDHTAAIMADTAAKLVASDATKFSQQLQKESVDLTAQSTALAALAQAYRQGGDAIKAIAVDKQFEKERTELAALQSEYSIAVQRFGVTSDAAQSLANAIAASSEQLENNVSVAKKIESQKIDLVIAQQEAAFNDELPTLQAVAAAYLQGAAAVRAMNVELQVNAFKKANPGATAAQIEEVTKKLEKEDAANRATQASQEASAYSFTAIAKTMVDKLGTIRKAISDGGQNTILVDAAIYDANQKIQEQYDAAAIKVGDLSEKFRAFLSEIKLQGQNLGEAVFGALLKSFDDLETRLAQFVVTGKANFKELYQSLEESIVKAGIQKVTSGIASSLGAALGFSGIPGGKRGDSASNPTFVSVVDSAGNILSTIAGAGGSSSGAGPLGGLLPGSASNNSAQAQQSQNFLQSITQGIASTMSSIFSGITSVLGSIGSAISSAFSGIGSLFGGFLAGGGDVSPGKAYIVGEEHPEFFVPRQSGKVAPTLKMGGTNVTQVDNHFYGVTDHDSFKRSETQISAFMGSSIQTAMARTR